MTIKQRNARHCWAFQYHVTQIQSNGVLYSWKPEKKTLLAGFAAEYETDQRSSVMIKHRLSADSGGAYFPA
jgi:hypothetical protein